MSLSIKTISLRGKENQKIKEIYKSSFPKEERLPFWFMILMTKITNTEFISFHDNNIPCGFAYLANVDNLTFIMFLAVDENLRSMGYGSNILDKIQSMHENNKIIITIERCDEDAINIEQRIRRKNFYLSNGYIETGYLVELKNIEQEILIKNGEFNELELLSFFKKYSNGAMKPKIWRKDS